MTAKWIGQAVSVVLGGWAFSDGRGTPVVLPHRLFGITDLISGQQQLSGQAVSVGQAVKLLSSSNGRCPSCFGAEC